MTDAAFFVERTQLAWTRTVLSLVIVAALMVRLGYESGAPSVGWVIGGADAMLAGALWLREDRLRHGRRTSSRALRLLAVATLLNAVAGGALALGL